MRDHRIFSRWKIDNRLRHYALARYLTVCAPRSSWTLAALERCKIAMHVRGRFVALLRIVRARFDEDVVELEQLLPIGALAQLRIDLRKIEPVFSGAGLVKKFAQTVNIGLRRSRSLRRDITFCADKRLLSTRRH